MKNLLVICNAFPPHSGTEASRAGQLCKYLPSYGWNPVVLCSRWTADNCAKYDSDFLPEVAASTVKEQLDPPTVISVGKPFRYFAIKLDRFLAGYANPREWSSAAIDAGLRIAASNQIDAIWATYPFRATLHAASRLSGELGVPWIADFRDILEQKCPTWKLPLERFNERRVVASASLITTTTPYLADVLSKRHGKQVNLLYNGYDPDSFRNVAAKTPNRFTIVYTGSLRGPDSRVQASPRALFVAVENLIRDGDIGENEIHIRILGATEKQLSPHLSSDGIRRKISLTEWASREEVFAWQKGAHLLLLLASGKMKGILTGKVFEYLAAKSRILAIPSDDDCIDALLNKTQAGTSASTVAEIQSSIRTSFEEWKANGSVACQSVDTEVQKFGRKNQASDLANWINQIATP